MNGVTKTMHSAPRKICGVGYVILGRGQDKDTYISSSFRNNRISIITDEGEVISGCIVSKNVWQYLEFPATVKSRGSQVVWINIPYQNRVIILDVLHKRDELNNIQIPNQFKFQREVGNNIVTVQGEGQTGTISIVAQGEADKEGELYVKILNSSELGLFSTYVQGIMSVDVEKDLNFRTGNSVTFTVRDESNPDSAGLFNYVLGAGYSLLDEFKNNFQTNKNGIFNEVPDSVKVYARASGASSEPGLLGDKTYTLLNEIKNLLTSIVTTIQTASAIPPNVLTAPISAQISNWLDSTAKLATEIETIKAKNFELS
jgi:hypothetical protein